MEDHIIEEATIQKVRDQFRKDYIANSLSKISDNEVTNMALKIVTILSESLYTFIEEPELDEIKTKLDDVIRPTRELYGITYDELHYRVHMVSHRLNYSLFSEDDNFSHRMSTAVYNKMKEIMNCG